MSASRQWQPGGDTLAVALGANLGDPEATLTMVRPRLEAALAGWGGTPLVRGCRWSPLFRTAPVGGPPDQPAYVNAVLVAGPLLVPTPDPRELLQALLALERAFGRVRGERWGPRLLDLDLLWCGACRLQAPALELPHPRLQQRRFVLEPLAAIDPALSPPGGEGAPPPSVADLLAQLQAAAASSMAAASAEAEPPPQRLPPRPGWPE
ncbi:2-amino-4-hydroxy-6-hydroxymethyldihydropteridine diphosphokinase [Cyanobium sp. FGCU-52]|nr:2-amino-4-hydroxy-6-hydroxymethyldihydropteridine diphosphokinase [Cyanobium sp. FGCU52]